MDTFVDELKMVRAALDLREMNLLGHSWGGWLALQYALGRPAGLASLTLASTCASIPAYEKQARRLKNSLPDNAGAIIDRHEADATTDDPEYMLAFRIYNATYVCRVQPLPEHVKHSVMKINETVYGAMLGAEWTSPATSPDGTSPTGCANSTCRSSSPQVATTR